MDVRGSLSRSEHHVHLQQLLDCEGDGKKRERVAPMFMDKFCRSDILDRVVSPQDDLSLDVGLHQDTYVSRASTKSTIPSMASR
jgi:hypothetical protein